MAECRTCGAPIRWHYTTGGRRIPIDTQPVDDGNIVLRGNTAHVVGDETQIPRGEPRYVSHFVMCPDADTHRRPRSSARRGLEG